MCNYKDIVYDVTLNTCFCLLEVHFYYFSVIFAYNINL